MLGFYVRVLTGPIKYNRLVVFEEINDQNAFKGDICSNLYDNLLILGVF